MSGKLSFFSSKTVESFLIHKSIKIGFPFSDCDLLFAMLEEKTHRTGLFPIDDTTLKDWKMFYLLRLSFTLFKHSTKHEFSIKIDFFVVVGKIKMKDVKS